MAQHLILTFCIQCRWIYMLPGFLFFFPITGLAKQTGGGG